MRTASTFNIAGLSIFLLTGMVAPPFLAVALVYFLSTREPMNPALKLVMSIVVLVVAMIAATHWNVIKINGVDIFDVLAAVLTIAGAAWTAVGVTLDKKEREELELAISNNKVDPNTLASMLINASTYTSQGLLLLALAAVCLVTKPIVADVLKREDARPLSVQQKDQALDNANVQQQK